MDEQASVNQSALAVYCETVAEAASKFDQARIGMEAAVREGLEIRMLAEFPFEFGEEPSHGLDVSPDV